MCMHVHMCEGAHVCAVFYVHVKAMVNLGCCSSGLALPIRLGWVAREPQKVLCLHCPRVGITDKHSQAPIFFFFFN